MKLKCIYNTNNHNLSNIIDKLLVRVYNTHKSSYPNNIMILELNELSIVNRVYLVRYFIK